MVPFTLEINHFSDMSEDEFKNIFIGGIKLPNRLEEYIRVPLPENPKKLR